MKLKYEKDEKIRVESKGGETKTLIKNIIPDIKEKSKDIFTED